MNKNLTSFVPIHDTHWAIYEPAARMLIEQLKGMDVAIHLQHVADRQLEARSGSGNGDSKPYDVIDGIAIISMIGPMTKSPTSLQSGASTVQVRRQVRQAASDPDVSGIILRIDSPGGSVSGTSDLADEVASAARRKPFVAFVEDCCCSAAMWVASQAGAIYANRSSVIGSIGTYMVIDDSSRLFENAGIKVHVLSTGKQKGAGVEGAPITDEQLAAFQKTVDDINVHFLEAVARGRDMQALVAGEGIADGSVWIGQQAADNGLIDGIKSMDDLILEMAKMPKKKMPMKMEGTSAQQDVIDDAALTAAFPQSLKSALDSALIAVERAREHVQSVTPRIADVKALRESQTRSFSAERLAQVTALGESLGEMYGAYRQLANECECLNSTAPKGNDRAEARRELDDRADALLVSLTESKD